MAGKPTLHCPRPAFLKSACSGGLAILAATSMAALAPPRASAQSPSPALAEARIDAIVDWALKAGPYPGVSVAIAQHGRIFRKGYGWADIARNIPVTAQTRFPVGSITKSFTCLAALQLAAGGQVDLTAPIGRYVQALPSPDRAVPVQTLLTHTSGIPNYTDLPSFPMDHPLGISRRAVLDAFETQPLLFPSGTEFNYSNSDTYLLGLLVESVANEDYRTYVTTHILAPFGMSRSGFDARDDGAADRARGYRPGQHGFEAATLYDYDVPFAAGALVSTPSDLLKYRAGEFGAATRPAVRDSVVRTPPLADGSPNPYALGCLFVTTLDGHRKITHAGDIFGFSADYAFYPDDDLTIAIATNTQGAAFPPITIEHRLARALLGLPEPRIVDLALAADAASLFAGDYRVGKIRFLTERLSFVYANGALNLKLGEAADARLLPLRYQGGGRFVSSVDDEHVFAFTRRPDGSVELTMHYYEGVISAHKSAAAG